MADEFEVNYGDEEIGDGGEEIGDGVEILVEEVSNARGRECSHLGLMDVVRSKVARNITQRSESCMVISIVVQKNVTCITEKSKSSQKTFCSEKDGRI